MPDNEVLPFHILSLTLMYLTPTYPLRISSRPWKPFLIHPHQGSLQDTLQIHRSLQLTTLFDLLFIDHNVMQLSFLTRLCVCWKPETISCSFLVPENLPWLVSTHQHWMNECEMGRSRKESKEGGIKSVHRNNFLKILAICCLRISISQLTLFSYHWQLV